jgi:hypothetical protein
MWMVNPKILCRRHLLGEHVELHMFAGAFAKGTRAGRFVTENLLEFGALRSRHEELVREMKARGYKHGSPWKPLPKCEQITKAERAAKIDRPAALAELLRRCPECSANFKLISSHE